MPRIASRLVGNRLLFYALLVLYIAGLALGGEACRVAAMLVPAVPMLLVAALTVDYALERDYVTALSGAVLLTFLLLASLYLQGG